LREIKRLEDIRTEFAYAVPPGVRPSSKPSQPHFGQPRAIPHGNLIDPGAVLLAAIVAFSAYRENVEAALH
jgi:hypothetical protein